VKRAASLLMLAALLATGCAKRSASQSEQTCACEGSAVVDATLLAWLSKARALHHEADVAEADGTPAKAVSALERILSGPAPAGPEASEIVADTRARLAELRAGTGDFDRAADDVKDGLLHAREPSYFRGHLFEVLGLVEEKRAAALEKRGDAVGARAARQRAVEASEQAVKLQDEVIQRALQKDKR
jgi:hypothetical protein